MQTQTALKKPGWVPGLCFFKRLIFIDRSATMIIADHTCSRPLTALPCGRTVTVVKFFIIVGAKVALLELLHQTFLFHRTATTGF